ncbi:MAG UNVERIFIED_CONTAM: hypothetical protein LVR29_20980 [Microcystis novacekii LVE1205-3]
MQWVNAPDEIFAVKYGRNGKSNHRRIVRLLRYFRIDGSKGITIRHIAIDLTHRYFQFIPSLLPNLRALF